MDKMEREYFDLQFQTINGKIDTQGKELENQRNTQRTLFRKLDDQGIALNKHINDDIEVQGKMNVSLAQLADKDVQMVAEVKRLAEEKAAATKWAWGVAASIISALAVATVMWLVTRPG